MKRIIPAIISFMLIITMVMPMAASGEGSSVAVDATGDCTIRISYSGMKAAAMTDRKLSTVWQSNPDSNPWVEVVAPSGVPIYGLFIKFGSKVPESYIIQREVDGAWENVCQGNQLFHAYYPFPEGEKHLRIYVTEDSKKSVLSISEIYALTDGTLPDWVETWHTPLKADALVVVGRVSDECGVYGSLLPSIADREVVVASFTCASSQKRSEMLTALWQMGMRAAPDIRMGKETSSDSMKAAYGANGGESTVSGWAMEMIRKYMPEVVFAPAVEKADGSYQNGVVGKSVADVFAVANDDTQYMDSSLAYGPWQPKKLYIHGGEKLPSTQEAENRAVIAYDSYTKNKSTLSYEKKMEKFGGNCFTLAENHTDAVFADIWGGTELTEWTPEAVAVPVTRKTEEPYYVSKLPALNERGFLDQGEFVYDSDDEGLYIFLNDSCKVVITRKEDKSQPLVWFEAEIWTDIENGVIPGNWWYDDVKQAKVVKNANETAKKHHLAFAMNTDYFYYRTASSGSRHVGVVIRNGQILYDDRYPEPSNEFPNLDTLAIYSDGRMIAGEGSAMSAQEYIDQGAVNVYSFGPWLIHNGELRENLAKISHSNNPRCAIGMIEPGHYMAMLCEGRLKDSGGISVTQLSLMMRAKGCVEACNMDGGQTCVFEFMGRQLNRIGKYDGGKTSARFTTDVLGVGVTDQVQ